MIVVIIVFTYILQLCCLLLLNVQAYVLGIDLTPSCPFDSVLLLFVHNIHHLWNSQFHLPIFFFAFFFSSFLTTYQFVILYDHLPSSILVTWLAQFYFYILTSCTKFLAFLIFFSIFFNLISYLIFTFSIDLIMALNIVSTFYFLFFCGCPSLWSIW